MGFNRFSVNVIIRSILIGLNALLIAFFSSNSKWAFTFIFLCFLFIQQLILFIRYSNKINRDLAHFLIHLKEQDTTLAFSKNNLNKTFSGLTKQFEKINKEFSNIKDQEIRKQNFLNLLLDRVGTGILVLNDKNEIVLHNKALFDLLGVHEHTNNKHLLEIIYTTINEIDALLPGEQKIKTIHISNLTRRILVALSEIKENNQIQKIYSFHDIDREMTDYELQSWNGLIKVFSHEIMNTLTPLSTVIDTLKDCLTLNEHEKALNELIDKDISDSVIGIRILENRIGSLKEFIKKFRQFSDIPNPELSKINIYSFIKDIISTYKNDSYKIDYIVELSADCKHLYADKELIELVFNNVIKNAIEALKSIENPKIVIKTYKTVNNMMIEFFDNGTEIEPSIIKKVFLPFYTTKEHGSGIGLSLARQIMFSHKGNIELLSNSEGTTVKLIFKDKE